jgi:squalene synthase HpnC
VSDVPASLADAYAECEKLARSHYENFPVASWLLPAAMRPHIAALYAFARIADDLADEGTALPDERRISLDRWLAGLHRAAGVSETIPAAAPAGSDGRSIDREAREARILMAAGHSIRTLDLPMALFDDLVDAFGQDIMTTRYDSWHEVLDYCRRSANPVGRLVLRIAGYRDDQLDRSSDALCTALQLTNFWQDLGTDWRIGRLYVPADIVRAAGASEATLVGPRLTREWANAIERCVAFTRARFEDGQLVCDAVGGRLRAELRLTWLGGMRMLDLVERHRADLLDRRPTLSLREVPLILWRAGFWRRQARWLRNTGRLPS